MFSEDQKLTKKSFCSKMSFERKFASVLAFFMDSLEMLSDMETDLEDAGGVKDMKKSNGISLNVDDDSRNINAMCLSRESPKETRRIF